MKSLVKKSAVAGMSVLLLAACNNSLDIRPTQSIEASQALNTAQDVQISLTGTYDGLSSTSLYGGGIQYIGELLGDNRDVVFGGTFATLDEIWRKSITTSNTVVSGTWLAAYSTINRANGVLAALDKVSQANRNSVEGQARFIRGCLYFELVKLFGKSYNDGTPSQNLGVPIVLTPTSTISDADFRARNTVAEVYTQVLADLVRAESLLAESSSSGFASKGAVQAMLARVYLQQQNFAAARDAANRAITSGSYTLASTFSAALADNSPEMIFKIIVTDQDGANDLNTFYASTRNSGRGDIRVQSKFRQLYGASDVRGQYFKTVSGNVFTNKYDDLFGDVPVVRLAEMYLIRAETNFRLNTLIGASPLADVNLIRSRAGAIALTSVTLANILLERRLELAFEGQQLADVKRTAGSVTTGTTTLTYNDNRLVLPIPQREIDTNKNLVQNPGY